MYVWLDDVRPAPEGFVWAKNAFYAIELIKSRKVKFISFDHDLGGDDEETLYKNNGYAVACEIERLAHDNKIEPIAYEIHSANPVGRMRIDFAMRSAQRYWETYTGDWGKA